MDKKLTIFGGTGKVGHILIKKALEQGYVIDALAREPMMLSDIENAKLNVITAELDDYNEIKKAVAGSDAVVSVMGPTGTTIGTPMVDGAKNIIKAMAETGVKRLIYLSTPSFRVPKDGSDVRFNFARWLVKNFNGTAYENIVVPSEAIVSSPLDYTLVRVPKLSCQPAKSQFVTGYIGDKQLHLFSLTREDLADFLLKQVSDLEFNRQAPIVSN